ncbi:MAG TPA: uracil-DNA glycosylase [Candidatus Brocadiia bacterium]|nr:uracil-DNA glycosylase [Candidatus Brocadiia bacterium]
MASEKSAHEASRDRVRMAVRERLEMERAFGADDIFLSPRKGQSESPRVDSAAESRDHVIAPDQAIVNTGSAGMDLKPAPTSVGRADAIIAEEMDRLLDRQVIRLDRDLLSDAARDETLEKIMEDLGDCRRCSLWQTRGKLVFGEGNPKAEIMFVGEAPGADEDAQGRPFVGRAGKLLDKMIRAMGRKREDVFIANVLKSRPPENRAPMPDEVAACGPFLKRQISAIKPKVIIALGLPACHFLTGGSESMSMMRGRIFIYEGFPLVPTYHPAYLLRSPGAKDASWQDLKVALAVLTRGL